MVSKVNELSNTIDLESTLIRAEALFRRFQRMVESIDKKGNFPNPKLRHRVHNASLGGAQPLRSTSSEATSSGVDVAASTAGEGSNATKNGGAAGSNGVDNTANNKGKKRDSIGNRNATDGELEDLRPKTISTELRGLLSRKVEILPRKLVRKEGEGIAGVKGGKR